MIKRFCYCLSLFVVLLTPLVFVNQVAALPVGEFSSFIPVCNKGAVATNTSVCGDVNSQTKQNNIFITIIRDVIDLISFAVGVASIYIIIIIAMIPTTQARIVTPVLIRLVTAEPLLPQFWPAPSWLMPAQALVLEVENPPAYAVCSAIGDNGSKTAASIISVFSMNFLMNHLILSNTNITKVCANSTTTIPANAPKMARLASAAAFESPPELVIRMAAMMSI